MSLLMLAAVAVSSLQFRLGSGATVQVSYVPAEMSQADAGRTARSISRFIWDDFCGPSRQTKCAAGKYYFIDMSLQNRMFRFCSASIAYRGTAPAGAYQSWADYTCTSKQGDPEFHPVRDNTDVPVFSPRSR